MVHLNAQINVTEIRIKNTVVSKKTHHPRKKKTHGAKVANDCRIFHQNK